MNAASSSGEIPPSGPTTTISSPDDGSAAAARRLAGVLVQDRARLRRPSRAATSAVDASGDSAGTQARRLCFAASRAVRRHLSQRLVAPRPVPLRDRACRGPRHDLVDAELGHHLDGELGAVALGQGLHDDEPRLRPAARDRRARTASRRPSPATAATTQCEQHAGAVGDQDVLTDAEPLDPRGVPALVTAEVQLVAVGQIVDQEQRRGHRLLPEGVAHLAEQAGRLRGDRDVLVAQVGQLAQQPLLLLVEPGRGTDLDVHVAGRRGSSCAACGTPLPRRCSTAPLCVPGRISIFSSPSRVVSTRSLPSAAEVIGTPIVQCRSAPSRVNVSCGCSAISMYRSPAGPPPGPTSPCPASRIRMPSSMPAGTSTVLVRRARTRPSVPQVGHGDGICSPVPPQAEQARVVMT